MIGSLLAIISAICFAFNAIFLRRAVLEVSHASVGLLITVPMTLPLFVLILVPSGQMHHLLDLRWENYIWLALSGVSFFVLGRALYYKCLQLVGANIANILRRVNIIIAFIVGTSLLSEPFSWQLVMGIFFIMGGITLAGISSQALPDGKGQLTRIPAKALWWGFGCGLAWGVAPIFAKLGLKGLDAPLAGAFIAYLAASMVLGITLLNRRRRSMITRISRKGAAWFFAAGLMSFLANLARYAALDQSPASVVTPLVSIAPVFILVLSFLFNRKVEVFTRPVIIGTVAVVMGSLLII